MTRKPVDTSRTTWKIIAIQLLVGSSVVVVYGMFDRWTFPWSVDFPTGSFLLWTLKAEVGSVMAVAIAWKIAGYLGSYLTIGWLMPLNMVREDTALVSVVFFAIVAGLFSGFIGLVDPIQPKPTALERWTDF